jgi:predicted LPLAT superfamily acyltransferase
MKGLGYRFLVRMTRLCGPWLLVVFSRIVAVGYFLFSGKVPESRRFYGALFPERRGIYHLWCAFRQYQNFTTIHLDRFLASRTDTTTFTSQGWEKLEAVIGKQGGILLMSHLGNWEIAAKLLRRQKEDLRLLLYMGVKEKEGVEHMQKEDLRRAGVTIIGVDQDGGSPFAAVDGIRHLQAGGIVSMTGDIVWRSDQRKVRVRFLGHDAWVPEAPYIFALLSGAPLFVFFAFRTGTNEYRFTLSDPIAIKPHARRDRDPAIAAAAQQYADLLEKMLRQHPFEWYHFERFLQLPENSKEPGEEKTAGFNEA